MLENGIGRSRLGHVLVDALAQVLDALVDAEQVLRLAGVGDDALGVRQVVGVEPVFATRTRCGSAGRSRALDDLGEARRDRGSGAASTPWLSARSFTYAAISSNQLSTPAIQLDVAALRHEILAVDAHARCLRLLVHQVHVGDEAVGAAARRATRFDSAQNAVGVDRRSAAGTCIPASACGDSVPSKS